MSDKDTELLLCMGQTVTRLLGIVERLQDENAELRKELGNERLMRTIAQRQPVTIPSVATPTVTWGPKTVTCNGGDAE